MYEQIARYIRDHKNEVLKRWLQRMKEIGDEQQLNFMSEENFLKTSSEFIDVIVDNIHITNDEFSKKVVDFAERVVRYGWPMIFVTAGIRMLGQVVFEMMQEEGVIEPEEQGYLYYTFDRWVTPMYNKVVNTYATSWEKTVSLQKVALQELSAPLLPIFEKISVMPLIGTIDTERAKLIMENLLNGVVKHRSEVVLIDITGVPVVDTMVAHHLIQAADAVRLVGSKCMLVGIRPEIAQTIVNLGIDLTQVMTTNTLRKGIEKALELTGRKIVSMEDSH